MSRKRVVSLAVAVVALAAGLTAAVYLNAGGSDKLRPREVPVRVAFAAPAPGPSAVAHYQAEVRDLTRDDVQTVSPVEFTAVDAAVDSHVVWLTLDYYHTYLVRVRGVAAGGAVGPWSEWSDPHENTSPWQTPEPPAD